MNPTIVVTSRRIIHEIADEISCMRLKCQVVSFEEFISSQLHPHPKAVGNGMHMGYYARLLKKHSIIQVKNIFEIGANYGQDAKYLQLFFGVLDKNVYTFEANPSISNAIDEMYSFSNFNYAVSDTAGKVIVHLVPDDNPNSGISTIASYAYAKEWPQVEVPCICMKDFLEEHKDIEEINFLKVDVEGLNFEVLHGFGSKLSIVHAIQIEGDNVPFFEGHKLFEDIARLLFDNGFELIDYRLHEKNTQSDSFWIHKDFLKKFNLEVP